MVVLLQQSVLPIYATFFKKYSIKLRLLSRTWPNISKLECTVLILRPSMFRAAVVKRLVPASLNAWRHRTASVENDADGWKWPKPKNIGKTLTTKKHKNRKKTKKTKKNKKNKNKQKNKKKQKKNKDPSNYEPPNLSLESLFFFCLFWFFRFSVMEFNV